MARQAVGDAILRVGLTTRPLTGALTTSNSGGHFPTEMKRAGYEGIILTGRAAEPTYLYVSPGKTELRPAGHLWGKDTEETSDPLLEETDRKARVSCIGPAGERLVRFACVMNEKHRPAGRSGVGAVMGSKPSRGASYGALLAHNRSICNPACIWFSDNTG